MSVNAASEANHVMFRKCVTVAVLFATACVSTSPQDTGLDTVIAQYEIFAQSGDPEAAARAAHQTPQRWGEVTPEYVAARAATAQALLDQLNQLDNNPRGPETAILRHALQAEIDAYTYDAARVPLVGDWGFFAEPHFAANSTRLTSRGDAEAWIARLNDVPRYFDDNIANMRRGMAQSWTAHGDPLATSLEQVREQIVEDAAESGLYAPFLTLPADMDTDTAARLQAEGLASAARAIAAYRGLKVFLETEYAPAARPEPGLGSLQGGMAAYEAAITSYTAGSGYSAADIHALGRSEVARIRAEMEAIIADLNFQGSFTDFTDFLRTDPSFYAETPQDLLEKAAEISKRLDAILPRYFGKLPRLTYGVEAVPAAIAPGYTTGRYSGGNAEAGIAGTYLVNTYALDQRPLYELPALSAHEAVPGHHLQISLAQELENVPEFRKSYYATAFGEGWGLYAEKLAGEAGIYRTPYERFGQLSYEMWRACRLVVDTGLHAYGWSREQAEACFIDNTALAPLNIETEVTRYIGWPGQATGYKIGELKILDLRKRAKTALGEDFDIRAFHDHLLGAGSMPMDALEARMSAWIEGQTQ